MKENKSSDLLKATVAGAVDKKAESVVSLDLKKLTSFTDYFLICHGNSTKHVQAIADSVTESAREAGYQLNGKEGYQQAEWILIDYVDVIIHVFLKDRRDFFDLESLWSDAPRTEYSTGDNN